MKSQVRCCPDIYEAELRSYYTQPVLLNIFSSSWFPYTTQVIIIFF